MRTLSRCLLAAALLVASSPNVAAQGAPPGPRAPGAPPAGGELRGRLVAAGSGQPVTSGSVAVRRGRETAFAGGTLPRPDGSFVVDGLLPGTYTVRIRALGYAPVLKGDVVISAQQRSVDLGSITLTQAAATLEGQVVTAERDDIQLSPERNSYSVKNMVTASGGTAVDALRNVPSVEVDAENKLSLRGNDNVVVQINGRTSPLRGEQLGTFLSQLPASVLSRIEVATNPSAREDPEGTAGIINIVMTQQVELGRSGGFSVGTGTTRLANLSGNVGTQTGPWTLFTSVSGSRDPKRFIGWSARATPGPSYLDADLDARQRPLSGNVLARSEYRLNARDALSFDGMVGRGRVARDNTVHYTNRDAERDIVGRFDQFANAVSRNSVQDYTVAFRRTGPPTASTFSTELRHTLFNMRHENLRSTTLLDAPAGESATPVERDRLNVRFPVWTLQSDYVRPLGAGSKLEVGFKSTLRNLGSTSGASRFEEADGEFVSLRENGIQYREAIQALYGMAARTFGKVQAQVGLRAEQSGTRLRVPSSTHDYDKRYGSLFPNASLAFNATAMRQLRASYARRITRPQAPQLDPAEFYESSRIVSRGNPALQPEYTDAIELGFQQTLPWGSVQVNPYLRMTNDAVRNIRTVTDDGLTVSTFANVANVRTLGSDVNVNVRRKALTLGTGGGVFDYRSEGGTLSAHALVWNTRANVTYAMSSRLDLQAQANYRSRMRVEGGTLLPLLSTNFALRRKLWGESGSLSLRAVDPFSTFNFTMRTETNGVVEETERRFGGRGVFLTISRNFGQQLKLRPRTESEDTQTGGQP